MLGDKNAFVVSDPLGFGNGILCGEWGGSNKLVLGMKIDDGESGVVKGEDELVVVEEGSGGDGSWLGMFKFSFLWFKYRIHNEYNEEKIELLRCK